MPKTTGLTEKQAQFAQEYLIDLNATQAAIRAGYSARTAGRIAHVLLQIPGIAQAIQDGRAARAKRTEISQDWVLEQFRKIAAGDIREMFDDQGRLKLPSELSDDAAATLASIEVVTRQVAGGDRAEIEYVHKIRAWDKLTALTQLGRHLGMFKDNLNVGGNLTVNITGDDAKL